MAAISVSAATRDAGVLLGAQPGRDGVHGSQRRARRRRPPDGRGERRRRDDRRAALPIDPAARAGSNPPASIRSPKRSAAATITSCCSPHRQARRPPSAAARHGGVALTRIGTCTGSTVVLAGHVDGQNASEPTARGIQPLSMIHLTRALVRRWLDTLLHVDDTPERTAAAFALGVLLRLLAVSRPPHAARARGRVLFDLNRVAVLLGVYSNLPWIIAGYYAFTTMVGAAITGSGCRRISNIVLWPCFSCRSGATSSGTSSPAAAAAAHAVHGGIADRRARSSLRSRTRSRWRSSGAGEACRCCTIASALTGRVPG